MALYTWACTVVRTEAGLSGSFEVKVGLHQGSVLSPLLFAAAMDVISSEGRSGLPSELLYVDGLVIMAPTMEQLSRRVAPNDTAYKQWSCHSGFKLLCKLCRTSPPPAMGARFTFFWACRSDNFKQESLDL